MKIKSTMKNFYNKTYRIEYEDFDDFSSLPLEQCSQVYGVCFINNQIIIVKGEGSWGLPGGTIEKGESIDQALKREIIEETNSEVLRWIPIGAQKVFDPDGGFTYQLRACALVKKLGEFTFDPGGPITENKLINPLDYKKYFDWGEVGERIITRGIDLRKKL